MSVALARRGAQVTAIDPSAGAIDAGQRHAAEKNLDIDFRRGVGEDLDIQDSSVDVVVCVDVLEHVADVPRTLDEITRVLRPGGLFLFDTINRNWLARLLVVTMAEDVLRLLPKGAHDPDLFIKPGELRGQLSERGFEDIRLAGLGPKGLNHRLDLTFGQVPTTLVQYMGGARLDAPAIIAESIEL